MISSTGLLPLGAGMCSSISPYGFVGLAISAYSGLLFQGPLQECLDLAGNFVRMSLQREMTGVEEMNLRIRIIACERLRSGRQKERIILSPDRQQGWPAFAEESLKLRIKRDIAGVIQKQVELDFVISRSGEER